MSERYHMILSPNRNVWRVERAGRAAILSDAGYFTLLSGKWHVGEPVGMRPHDVGFDEFYGTLAG